MANLQFHNRLKSTWAELQQNSRRPGRYVYDLLNRVSSIRLTEVRAELRLRISYFFDYVRDTWRFIERQSRQPKDAGKSIDLGIKNAVFLSRLSQPGVVSEFFFPIEYASWRGGRFSINTGKASLVHSGISGVRLQAAVETDPDRLLERQCQQDVTNLVRSLMQLRETPGLDNVSLSNEMLVTPQPNIPGTRVKFGLRQDPDGRLRNDNEAAWECYRQIVRAARKSRFVVERPRSFMPNTGMVGLVAWGEALKLRRRARLWPWILLLLALLHLIRDCSVPRWAGIPIETSGLIVLVDKSGSMLPHHPVLQAEAKRVLGRTADSLFSRYAVDFIAYDAVATSALGGLKELTDENREQLQHFVDNLQTTGGTNLRSGIDLAAREVAAYNKPTTLIILTDGEDSSIAQMLQNKSELLAAFKNVEIIGNTLTPRLFGDKVGPTTPINDAERQLSELAEALEGQFGPDEER